MSGDYGQDIEDALLAELQTVIWPDLNPANILVRTIPTVDEVINTVPSLFLSPATVPEEHEHDDFEGGTSLIYPFQVAYITAANRDFAAKPKQRQFRRLLRRLFDSGTLARVPGVWDIEFRLTPLYDRSQLARQYAYNNVLLLVYSHEADD